MSRIEDRHALFLIGNRSRLDQLAPLHVSEHGRGFWVVLDPPRDGATPASGSCRKVPAWRPSAPDLPRPFDPARDHLVVIFESTLGRGELACPRLPT
jgi:hypothetical protein